MQLLNLLVSISISDYWHVVRDKVDDLWQLNRLCDEQPTHIGDFLIAIVVTRSCVLHQLNVNFSSICRLLETTYVSCQVHDPIFTLMIVRGRLDEEVLVRFLLTLEPVVAKGRERVRQYAILVVLRDTTKLNDTVVHLWVQRHNIFVTEQGLHAVCIEVKVFLGYLRESRIGSVFPALTVLMHYERVDQCHDWLIEGVH